MTREAIEYFKFHRKIFCDDHLKICPKDSIAYQATLKEKEFYDMAIKALEQEPFINKSCVSSGVCEHDKNVVINEIRAEIEELDYITFDGITKRRCLEIIDKHKAESEEDFTNECKRLDGDCDKCTHKYHCCSSERNGRH